MSTEINKVKHRGQELQFAYHIPGRVAYFHKQGKVYEKRMLEYIRKLEVDGVYIDVGANVGNHSFFFATFCNPSKVIAVEPMPEIYDTLLENLELNPEFAKKIHPEHVAASNKKGTVGLVYEPRGHGYLTQTTFEKKAKNVQAVPLDNLVSEKDGKVGLIKIDVEGFEAHVLQGAKKILQKFHPHLFVEAHNKEFRQEIENIIAPLGYKAQKVFNASPTYHYACQEVSKLDDALLQLKQFRAFRRA